MRVGPKRVGWAKELSRVGCARRIIPGRGLGTPPPGIFKACWALVWAPAPGAPPHGQGRRMSA